MAEDLKNFKIKLGKRIKELREKKGFTQPELAALLNKDYQALGRIENGRINPSSYIVYQIAKALDVPMNELFDFSKVE
jgi:putative transcriptional regulator